MTTTWAQRRKTRIDDLAGGRSPSSEALRRLRRNPAAVGGAVIVGSFVAVALLAPLIAPHGAADVIPELRASPAGAHPGFPLGGDELGRDLWSRMLLASRQTLAIGVGATVVGLAVGVAIGMLAGALGGWTDGVLTWVTDVLLSIPGLLLAISVAVLVASRSQATVIIAVATVNAAVFARLLRGAMLAQRHSDHVVAITALGVRRPAVVLRHVVPHAIGPVIVQAAMVLGTSILDAAALSFLGLGDADPDRAEWGLMLAHALSIVDARPAMVLPPAVAITVVVLGFTMIGESLRGALEPAGRE